MIIRPTRAFVAATFGAFGLLAATAPAANAIGAGAGVAATHGDYPGAERSAKEAKGMGQRGRLIAPRAGVRGISPRARAGIRCGAARIANGTCR